MASDFSITVRLSKAEYDAIAKRAELDGQMASQWARRQLRKASKDTSEKLQPDAE